MTNVNCNKNEQRTLKKGTRMPIFKRCNNKLKNDPIDDCNSILNEETKKTLDTIKKSDLERLIEKYEWGKEKKADIFKKRDKFHCDLKRACQPIFDIEAFWGVVCEINLWGFGCKQQLDVKNECDNEKRTKIFKTILDILKIPDDIKRLYWATKYLIWKNVEGTIRIDNEENYKIEWHIDNMGHVMASKLLAHLFPEKIPIYDSRVAKGLNMYFNCKFVSIPPDPSGKRGLRNLTDNEYCMNFQKVTCVLRYLNNKLCLPIRDIEGAFFMKGQ
ncbi:MAG: hypothetical protein JNL74_15890 [Fibrobacteres bacterium]|nr:hypothetical protein [Fibrobacterota bacterium]